MRKAHTYSRQTVATAKLLGRMVRLGRVERRLTIADLAERVGVTDQTIRRLERGDPTVALGITLEAAVIAGVPLFGDDDARRRLEARHVDDRLALLPKSVREPVVSDAF